jgi:hypothetical protein
MEGAAGDPDARQIRFKGVKLQPADMEMAFWRSNTAARAIVSLNRWGLATSLLVTFIAGAAGMVKGNNRILSSSATTTALYVISMVLLCCQASCAYHHSWLYVRHSTFINMFTRMVRLLQTVCAYTDQHWYALLLSTAKEGSAAGGYRQLIYMVCTWPWFSLLNAVNFPLPWRWQWPTVLLKCSVDILLGAPLINCALQHPESQLASASEAACKQVLGSILSVGQLFVPVHAEAEEAMCGTSSSGLAITLFLLLFMGASVPLLITYWYEQHVKTQFLAAHGYCLEPRCSEPLQKIGWALACALLCCLVLRHMLSMDYFSTRHCSWSTGAA